MSTVSVMTVSRTDLRKQIVPFSPRQSFVSVTHFVPVSSFCAISPANSLLSLSPVMSAISSLLRPCPAATAFTSSTSSREAMRM